MDCRESGPDAPALAAAPETVSPPPPSYPYDSDAYALLSGLHARADRLVSVLAERGSRRELLVLVALLEHPTRDLRRHAAYVLSRGGAHTRAIWPELIAALKNPD